MIKHNAIDPDREILVINHIMQFKTVESHYVRRKATYEYLPPELSVSKMYVMYVKWCSENDPPKKAEKEDFYRRTFKTKFKFKFHMVKKDLCDTCITYRNAPELQRDDEKQSKHLEEQRLAR